MDKRRLPRKWEVIPGVESARAKVHEWLMQMYHKLAEPLPEASSIQNVAKDGVQPKGTKKRGRRPRHIVKVDKPGYHPEIKFLPPGTIASYLELCKADLKDVSVSKKLFCRVTWSQSSLKNLLDRFF